MGGYDGGRRGEVVGGEEGMKVVGYNGRGEEERMMWREEGEEAGRVGGWGGGGEVNVQGRGKGV